MKHHRWLSAVLGGLTLASMVLIGAMRTAAPVHAAGSLTLTHATVPQGATASVSGAGFTPNDAAVVYVDAPVNGHERRLQATTLTSNTGGLSTHLAVPRGIRPGTYTLTAKDAHGIAGTTRLTVLALIVLRPNGSDPSTTVVAYRSYFVDALGFSPKETVRIQTTFGAYGGNDIVETRTAATNANGNAVNVSMRVPVGARQAVAAVTATGVTSTKQAKGRISVVYRPTIAVRPASITAGSSTTVSGQGFVANASVRTQITVNSSSGSQTLSVTATTNGQGAFARSIRIPDYVNAGSYTVTVTDSATGLQRTAKLAVHPKTRPTAMPRPTSTPRPTATPSPTATLVPQYHPRIKVRPGKTLPNQNVTLTGSGYPSDVRLTVRVTIKLRGGGKRYIYRSPTTDVQGSFTTVFRVPYRSTAGSYTVKASGGGVRATDRLTVLALSTTPRSLKFQWVSLWYHKVRQGTSDYIKIQATPKSKLGIWVHVIFPSGRHQDFYKQTNNSGQWATRFSIPHGSVSKRSHHAYITLQLWHGKQSAQSFVDFTVL